MLIKDATDIGGQNELGKKNPSINCRGVTVGAIVKYL